jgi:hypothetical protein
MSVFYGAIARPEDEADDDPREVVIIASNGEEAESLCKSKYQAEGFTIVRTIELLCANGLVFRGLLATRAKNHLPGV